ncbi:MAG TPA: peptide chain release factor N(5)-glutamine methyltransferase [Gemmatimonadaceae bacterium]|nr:peptide chain release factor N(5)-glutamine methyltransferase [Gemmatimonadaceae bacterium]
MSDSPITSNPRTASAVIAELGAQGSDIIAALLEVPRSWPMMNRDAAIDAEIISAARNAASKLRKGAPFAYAVGTACFRHLNLLVDERVLIPRPETEVLVGEILDRMKPRAAWGTAIDIGTGSGAIALSLASEGKFERVIATDASLDALDVVRSNTERSRAALCAPVELRHGSLLAPVAGEKAQVVVSNPPYVAFAEAADLPAGVRDWEPPLALFSGHNGMNASAGIVRDSVSILEPGGILALEVDERRASLVAELMMQNGAYADIGVRLDLAGRERFVFATRI